MARRMPLSPSPGQDEVKSPVRILFQNAISARLKFFWARYRFEQKLVSSIAFPLVLFRWWFFHDLFHDIFHDFLWCFNDVSMIYPNFIMDISYPPHLAGRTSMAQADIGSQQKPRRRIPVSGFHTNLIRISSKPWMIWIFVYRFHINFIQIQWFHTNHFQILGKMFNWLLLRNTSMMWFTFYIYMYIWYMIESHDF